ncbi:1445_t:CDS:1, partial [Scutellospora calospora]
KDITPKILSNNEGLAKRTDKVILGVEQSVEEDRFTEILSRKNRRRKKADELASNK